MPTFSPTPEVDLLCPLCSDICPLDAAVWRDHDVRGTHVRFQVCPNCRDRTLCPANYHGIHGEVICEDEEIVGGRENVGYCAACRAEFQWRDGAWRDIPPPPIVTDLDALNGRLRRGEIDMDGYVAELDRLTRVEGSAPAADGDSERED